MKMTEKEKEKGRIKARLLQCGCSNMEADQLAQDVVNMPPEERLQNQIKFALEDNIEKLKKWKKEIEK
jgi:hypothetical protein